MYMKYKTKSTIVEAVRWNGYNYEEICDFVGMRLKRDASELFNGQPSNLLLRTLDDVIEVRVYDYIIKDAQGRLYSCKSDIFEMTYKWAE